MGYEQLEELRRDVDALRDRVAELEHSRPVPFFIPSRRATKVAAAIASAFVTLALVASFSPHKVELGPWRYQSEGIGMEAIASAGAAIGVWVTLKEHFKDKEQYRHRDD